jgi:hypothetical protein
MSFDNGKKVSCFVFGCEFDDSLQVLLKIFLQDDMSGESENFGFMMPKVEIQFDVCVAGRRFITSM